MTLMNLLLTTYILVLEEVLRTQTTAYALAGNVIRIKEPNPGGTL
jgi:hypothetical protein